jgi:hypothetical protein
MGKEMSNLNKHAMMEFKAAGWLNDDGEYLDEMQEAICRHVLALLDVFNDEGHSGSSAPYAINLFKTLAMFEPIAPLTGEDWEWTDVSDLGGRNDSKLYQNKRCGRVFKDETGAYDIEGKVFYEWYTDEYGEKFKSHYTSRDSRVPVTFPYKPTTVYEEYIENGDS